MKKTRQGENSPAVARCRRSRMGSRAMDEKAADLLSLEFIHDALWKLIVTAQIAQGQCELR